MAIRAVVVEEEPFVLEALCDFLEGCGVDVVIRAHDAPAAIRSVAGARPDVVLLGSGTMTGCGPDAVRAIAEAFPRVSIVSLGGPGQTSPRVLPPVIGGSRSIQIDGDPREFIETVRQAGAKAQYRLTWS